MMKTMEATDELYRVTTPAEFMALMERLKGEMTRADFADFAEIATMWGVSKKNSDPATFGSLFQ